MSRSVFKITNYSRIGDNMNPIEMIKSRGPFNNNPSRSTTNNHTKINIITQSPAIINPNNTPILTRMKLLSIASTTRATRTPNPPPSTIIGDIRTSFQEQQRKNVSHSPEMPAILSSKTSTSNCIIISIFSNQFPLSSNNSSSVLIENQDPNLPDTHHHRN